MLTPVPSKMLASAVERSFKSNQHLELLIRYQDQVTINHPNTDGDSAENRWQRHHPHTRFDELHEYPIYVSKVKC